MSKYKLISSSTILLLFLLLLLNVNTTLARRRVSQANRAFEDEQNRQFEYNNAPGGIGNEEETISSDFSTTTVSVSSDPKTTTTETTTKPPTTTTTTTEKPKNEDELVENLLEGIFNMDNLTKLVEEEYADTLNEATNRTVLWIDTSYKALDFNLTIDEIEECVEWQKYWNETIEAKKNQTLLNETLALNETIIEDFKDRENLKETELITSKKRLKEIGLNEELLEAYKAVGLVFREICGNHGRSLWYKTREDAARIGIDAASPICEPFKEELNPDAKTLSKLALTLNLLIQNVTEGLQPALKHGGNVSEALEDFAAEMVEEHKDQEGHGLDVRGNGLKDALETPGFRSSSPTESPETTTTRPEEINNSIHVASSDGDVDLPIQIQFATIKPSTSDTTTPPSITPSPIDAPALAPSSSEHDLQDDLASSSSEESSTTFEPPSEIEVYDDDVWDYRDMEKRFKVRHRMVFDDTDESNNEINDIGIAHSTTDSTNRRKKRSVVLKTKVRVKRGTDGEEKAEKKVELDVGEDESEDDWLNVRQIIKTEDGETTVAIIEENNRLLNGNLTDVHAWIEIDATDALNPTLLISAPEAVSALGLEVDPTAFQRFESVGLYLPGICSEYVPKAIDEFNSSSFAGVEIEGPIGVNISALELAGVNLTALAEKLRNDTEVDEILSRTNGSSKNLGGSFILPVLNKNQYDPFSAPIVFQGSAVVVRFGIYIESMSNFQTSTMDYDMDIYLMMSWRDARLVNPYDKPILVKEEDILEKIWRPDPFFANAKEAEFHEVTFLNFLMRIFPDGLVLYETRVKIKPSCNLILCKYPHDKQTCDLLIKSFAYPIETVRFEWFTRRKDAIDKNPDVKLPELYIDRYETTTCPNARKSGDFSCLRAVFRLKRDVGFHIAQTYIPTSLALMFSWVGVWLPEEFMEGRIGVAITVLLTLSTESAGAREHLPSVSYLKAIDLWFGFITGFVFFTLLQTLFVIGFDKRANQLRKWAGRKTADITEEIREALLQKATRYHKTGRYLDNFCRVFYPLSFILFLFMYYFVFTEGRQDDCMNRR